MAGTIKLNKQGNIVETDTTTSTGYKYLKYVGAGCYFSYYNSGVRNRYDTIKLSGKVETLIKRWFNGTLVAGEAHVGVCTDGLYFYTLIKNSISGTAAIRKYTKKFVLVKEIDVAGSFSFGSLSGFSTDKKYFYMIEDSSNVYKLEMFPPYNIAGHYDIGGFATNTTDLDYDKRYFWITQVTAAGPSTSTLYQVSSLGLTKTVTLNTANYLGIATESKDLLIGAGNVILP